MKSVFLTLVLISSTAFAAESNSFNLFAGSYEVAKRTCRNQDAVCATVDTVQIAFAKDNQVEVLELHKGQVLDKTTLFVYGTYSNKTSYGMIYGSGDVAAWKESIKNDSSQVTEENSLGIRQEANTNEEGPTYIFSFAKSHNTYEPSTGKSLIRALRNYSLIRK